MFSYLYRGLDNFKCEFVTKVQADAARNFMGVQKHELHRGTF